MNNKIKTLIFILIFITVVVGAKEILEMQGDSKSQNIIIDENVSNEQKEESGDIKTESTGRIISVNDETFEEEVLKAEKTVLVDFYATWCTPCKILAPIVEEFAKENENIKVVKVDIDEAEVTATKYGIISIPALLVIEDGEVKNSTVGIVSKEYIEKMIKQ